MIIYFIGVGGIGISAVARKYLAEGHKIFGSDSSASEITKLLEGLGVMVFIGQKKENLPKKIDLVIYTAAVKEDNPEFSEAKRRGLKMLSYAQALGEISRDKFTIAIAGTHGKTTTSAMIAQIMIEAGLDPTVIVGSLIKNKKDEVTNFISGKSEYFVVEACEYERSFLHLNPRIAVINNIDADHLDYYGDLDGVIQGFREFVQKVSVDGFVICDPDDSKVAKALVGARCKIIDRKKYNIKDAVLPVPGEHNRLNAATALAVAETLKINLTQARRSLENFQGAWRRFEYKGQTKTGALVYDDYAHNPQKVKAALQGAREMFPDKKIIVVFQPHLFSRTKLLLKEFSESFGDADEVILAPIFPAREKLDPTISSEILAEEIKKYNRTGYQNSHLSLTKEREAIRVTNQEFPASSSLVKEECQSADKAVVSFPNFPSIISYLQTHLGPNDVLITMGAGEQYKVGEELLK